MTTAQVIETSVTVNNIIQDYVHPNDQTQATLILLLLLFFFIIFLKLMLLPGLCIGRPI